MGGDEDFRRLRDAYATAWEAKGSGQSAAATELLVEQLDACGDEVFSGPGPGRDLIVRLWEQGVPPEQLKRRLLGALPGLAVSAVGAWAEAASQVLGYLRPR